MFFKLWLIVLLINQLFFYDLYFIPDCLILALPHTGMITVILYYFYNAVKIVIKKEHSVEESQNTYHEVLNSYDGILVALLAKIAKADGHITKEKANSMGKIYDVFSEERKTIPHIQEIYKDILNNEKENLKNINELCLKLIYLKIPQSQKIYLIETLVALAYIDSKDTKRSEVLLLKIVHSLYFDFTMYQNILSKYTKESSSKSSTTHSKIDEYYLLLKSTEEDNDSDIKKSYRKLVKQYHSDILESKDLPEDMIAFAEEKLKLINTAYEEIKKVRVRK
jgi:DnaJ like chaperone protein